MNNQPVRCECVSADDEESAANDESHGKKAQPERELTEMGRSEWLPTPNGNAETQQGSEN